MKKSFQSKSKNTLARIGVIKDSIKAHKKNIKLLYAFVNKRPEISSMRNQIRIVHYNAIGRNEATRHMTIKNLKDQIYALEIELKALVEFGA
jgi:hypothetical protein